MYKYRVLLPDGGVLGCADFNKLRRRVKSDSKFNSTRAHILKRKLHLALLAVERSEAEASPVIVYILKYYYF